MQINVINYAFMKIFKYIPKKITLFFTGAAILNLLWSCGIWDPADARKVPANVDDRVKKNLEEGRGFSINKMLAQDKQGTTYQFASSNPMWPYGSRKPSRPIYFGYLGAESFTSGF